MHVRTFVHGFFLAFDPRPVLGLGMGRKPKPTASDAQASAAPVLIPTPAKPRKATRGGTDDTAALRDERMTPLGILTAVRATGLGWHAGLLDPFASTESNVRKVWPGCLEIVKNKPMFLEERVKQGDGMKILPASEVMDAWVNPPWSTIPIDETLDIVARRPGRSVVLLPASCQEPYWRTIVWPAASWVAFLYGRWAFPATAGQNRATPLPHPIALTGFGWGSCFRVTQALSPIGKVVLL